MKYLIPLLLLMLLTSGCAAEQPRYAQIDQQTAMEMMARDDGHVIVDVRRQDEYDAGHIPGAILIPNETIDGVAPEALPDREQIILIYCRSGNRSKQAARKLADMGYVNIYEFGGITTWTGPVVTAEEERAASLSFRSFDGGGHVYTVEVADPSVLAWSGTFDYGPGDHSLETGSPYDQIFTFTGLKPGETTVTVYGRSPILENDDTVYRAVVDDALRVTLAPVREIATFYLYREGEMYHITREADGFHMSVNDGAEQAFDAASAEALAGAVEEYGLAAWDGFAESKRGVAHGETFMLEIRLTDGTYIMARGENACPDNYFPAMDAIRAILESAEIGSGEGEEEMMKLMIDNTEVPVTWEDNPSVAALRGLLPLTVRMSKYGGFEQVGPIGRSIVRDDAQTTTAPGDIVLYSGNQIVVFYGTNAWAYTRLGHVDLSEAELTSLLGGGDVTLTIK